MRIVVAHNYYGTGAQGGESVVFNQEIQILREAGHSVRTIVHKNSELLELPFIKRVGAPFKFGFNEQIYQEASELFLEFKPEIVHVHNYKFVLTPAIVQAAKKLNIPTVLTLHNYRLICPGGQLRRLNKICEECITQNPVRSLWRPGCCSSYSSRILQYLFFLQTKQRIIDNVDIFIALSDFSRTKFLEAGFPASKVEVKSNFIFDPLRGDRMTSIKDDITFDAIFVGRLSEEKGITFLLESWKNLDCKLAIVGSGPCSKLIKSHLAKNIIYLGEQPHNKTIQLMNKAKFVVFPSVWYEGLPIVILEALALGKPVIASNLGGRYELIEHNKSGFLFDLEDVEMFKHYVIKLNTNPFLCDSLGRMARQLYEERFLPKKNLERLLEIYNKAIRLNSRA